MSSSAPTRAPTEKDFHLWWLGLLLAVLGAFTSGIGENIVRRSFRFANEKRTRNWALFIFGWVWVFVIDAGTTVGALAFASAAMVAPTGGVHIVSVVFFAWLINGEPLFRRDGAGTLLILAGVTGVALLGPRAESRLSQEAIRTIFSIVGWVSVAVIPTLYCIWRHLSKDGADDRPRGGRSLVLRTASTLLGGFCGAMARVTLKAFESNFLKHVDCGTASRCVFADYRFYVVAMSLGLQFFAQFFFINWALGRFEAIAVVPVYSSAIACFSACMSIVLFQEWRDLPLLNMVALPFMFLPVIGGMWLMTKRAIPGEARGRTYDPVPDDT